MIYIITMTKKVLITLLKFKKGVYDINHIECPLFNVPSIYEDVNP